jgi:predicted RNA-binding Zn ribbon-like protein
MKRNIVRFVITTILLSTTFMTFAQEHETPERLVVADLPAFKHAKIDSVDDFTRFKKDAELKIAQNRKTIGVLMDRKSTRDTRTKYKMEVLKLQETNDYLAIKINASDMIRTTYWNSFKREFSKEMTELTTSIRDTENTYLNH